MRTNERAASTGLGCGTRTPSHVQPWLSALGLSLPLSSPPPHSRSCPTGHPTAWAVPPLCPQPCSCTRLHHGALSLFVPLCTAPSPRVAVQACTPLLPMCMPSAQVQPFSSVTSPLCMHIPSPYLHIFYLCVSPLLMCIHSPYVHPFSYASFCPLCIPSPHVHPFSLLILCINSPHVHPFSPYASLLPLCIPSPCVHPFSPYVSFLPICIPSAHVHPFSTCASLLPAGSHHDTMSGGSAAPRAPSGPCLAAGAPCPGTPGPAGLGRGPAAPAPCLLDLACRDDGADDALGLRQSRVAMETSDVILRRRGGVRTHPSGMQPVAGARGARTTGSP